MMCSVSVLPLAADSLISPEVKNPLEELELQPEKILKDYRECAGKLAAFETKYKAGKLGPECGQFSDRFMLANRLVVSLQKTAISRNAETLFFADRQLRDLKLFLRYFEEKEKLQNELAAAPAPVEFSLRDFGAKGDGVTDDAPAFEAAFRKIAELNGNPAKLLVPAGNYILGTSRPCKMTRQPFGPKHGIAEYQWEGLIVMNGFKNVTVSGENGKTILIQKSWNGTGIILANCENVRWENFIIRRDRPPFMQGTILEVYPAEKAILWKADPGFMQPDEPHNKGLINVCQSYDEKGNILRSASHHFFNHNKYVKNPDGTFKITLESFSPAFRPGLKFILPVRKSPNGAVWTAMCKFCVYDNVTINDSRGAAFSDVTSFGNEYLNCKIIPNKEIGAWFSTNADGIHGQNNDFGMFVQNCEFRRLGDDAFNTYVKGRLLEEVLPDGTIAGLGYEEGTFFSIVSADTGEIKASRTSLGADMEVKGNKKLSKTLISKPLPDYICSYDSLQQKKIDDQEMFKNQIGIVKNRFPDVLFAHGKSGTGTVIRDSIFEGMRNNQLVLQTSSALVENNLIENCTCIGVLITSLIHPWQEGFHAFNIVVRNNKLNRVNAGISYSMNAFDHAKSHKVPAFFDFLIENNEVESKTPYEKINPLFNAK